MSQGRQANINNFYLKSSFKDRNQRHIGDSALQRLALEVLQRLNRAETPNEAIEQILTAIKE